MHPVDVVNNPKLKRNPHREFAMEDDEDRKKDKKSGSAGKGAAADNGSDDEGDEENSSAAAASGKASKKTRRDPTTPLVAEDEIVKVFTNDKKHEDVIKSIQYISVGDKPLIMTASYDKNVHLIDFETQEIVGTLKQGYKSLYKYQWEFECEQFLKEHPERRSAVEAMLEEVREERIRTMSQRKAAEIRLLEAGDLKPSAYSGFAGVGSQIMGATSVGSSLRKDGFGDQTGGFGSTFGRSDDLGGTFSLGGDDYDMDLRTEAGRKKARVRDLIRNGKRMVEAQRMYADRQEERKRL